MSRPALHPARSRRTLTKGSDGAHEFTFIDAGFQLGHTYQLVRFSGTDLRVSDFSFTNAAPFDGDFSFAGDTILQFTLTAVPEPSTMVLAYFAATGLAVPLLRRRRKR